MPANALLKCGEGDLPFADVKMRVGPHVEWARIYQEVWRIERSFFYGRNLHGRNNSPSASLPGSCGGAFRNESKTYPSFAESVQAAFGTLPRTNPQCPGPPRNTPVRLITFSSPKGRLVHTLGS